MLDELVEKARDEQPPWDDVRRQKVQRRVLEARHEPPAEPSRRWPWAAAAVAAALVALAAGWAWWPSATPTATAARLDLPDGSHALLSPTAVVRQEPTEAGRIRLLQAAGRVTYDVRPDRQRPFEVEARGVLVRVHGTRFAVTILDPEAVVSVEVEEGRVAVTRPGAPPAVLGAGEALRVRSDEPRSATAPVSMDPEPAPDEDVSADPELAEVATAGVAAEAAPAVEAPRAPTVARALELADEARRRGRPTEAVRALERALRASPDDPRAGLAAFTLGRIEARRGRHRSAARAFTEAYAADPRGPVAEDALAQAARPGPGPESRAALAPRPPATSRVIPRASTGSGWLRSPSSDSAASRERRRPRGGALRRSPRRSPRARRSRGRPE